MERSEYAALSVEYFRDRVTIDDLASRLEEGIDIATDRIGADPGERVMLIANHPSAHSDLSIPAEEIAGLKGGNTRNFPDFWFPIIRQLMLRRALGRRFLTIGYDIGWRVAMQETWHLLIRHEGSGRCQEIISKLRETDCSVAIFPEGGVRNLETFRSGFFYIAYELGIRRLAVCRFSRELTLQGPNELRIVRLEDIGRIVDSVGEFVERSRLAISESLEPSIRQ